MPHISQKQINKKVLHHTHADTHGSNANHLMGHGSAKDFLKRFWLVTFLLLPLAAVHPAVAEFFGIGGFALNKWIQFGIATIIFFIGLVFFRHAWHEISERKYGMMTLVSIAVGGGYLFSVVSTFIPSLDAQFYLEISTLIWVLLFGHYLEARSSAAAGDALSKIAQLIPSSAHKIDGEKEYDVAVEKLIVGDVVAVKPGEKIPADGIVIAGQVSVNESHITGESAPIVKKEGDSVVAGSLATDSSIRIKITRTGEHSTVGQIKALVARAQETKPASQRLADKAARVLTMVAGLTALLTLVVWFVIADKPFSFAATLAITVLVIACPHALGLAIPTVTTITMSLASQNGLFIKNLAKIEVLKRADTIVMDKTGTLTEGKFGVTDVISFGGFSQNDVLSVAASIDSASSHPIARAIVTYAKTRSIVLFPVKEFLHTSGKGSLGLVREKRYAVGNEAMVLSLVSIAEDARAAAARLSLEEKTVVFISDESGVKGVIGLSDVIKKESFRAIKALHKRGIKIVMLSGDNKKVTSRVALALGIDEYFAEVKPDEKYAHIINLQKNGGIVVMIGDGVNDAPALAQADVGVAIGAGTDVAVESGDVVLIKSNPMDLVRLVDLSRAVYRKMIQNLVWALGYNIVAIPAAAGVFAAWGFFLRPEIGALVMSLSTVIVVINALSLKRMYIGEIKS